MGKLSHKANAVTVLNIFVRGATLASKLILTVYMSRFLSLESIGVYGLIMATVGITNICIGFNFNFFSKREIVSQDGLSAGRTVRDQLFFFFVQYVLIFIVTVWVSSSAFVDIPYLKYFIAIIILEHFTYSLNESLLGLGRVTLANMLFFIRSGLWVFPVVLLGFFSPSLRNVETIFNWWILAMLLHAIACFCLYRKWPWKEIISKSVDYKWIKNGVNASILAWISMLGLCGAVYVDRYIIATYLGLEIVGIYTIFWMLANAVEVLITAGVIAAALPKLIQYRAENEMRAFHNEFYLTIKKTVAFSIVVILGLGIIYPLIAVLLKQPLLDQYTDVFWIMLLGVFLKTITVVLNQYFYAQRLDKYMTLPRILLLFISLPMNLVLIPKYGLIGSAYAMVVTFFIGCLVAVALIQRSNASERGRLYEK